MRTGEIGNGNTINHTVTKLCSTVSMDNLPRSEIYAHLKKPKYHIFTTSNSSVNELKEKDIATLQKSEIHSELFHPDFRNNSVTKRIPLRNRSVDFLNSKKVITEGQHHNNYNGASNGPHSVYDHITSQQKASEEIKQ